MPQPLTVRGLTASDIRRTISLLGKTLVNIKDEKGTWILKLPDGRLLDTKGWDDWEWTHGIALYGMYQYHALTGSNVSLRIMTDWYRARLAEGTTKNVNTMSVFLTLAYLYEETGEMSYLPWLDSWAEWVMYRLPRTKYGGFQHMTYLDENKDQIWDDTLIMTVMPLAKIGKLLNRPHYVEEAKRQFLIHLQYLFDTSTGLFFHGWKFDDSQGGVGHNFARARWARGNAWITIAIPDFIEMLELQEGDPIRMHLTSILEAQVRRLAELQDESGLWRTLLDVPIEEGSYLESSASAGFAYGILKAVRRRYIPREFAEVGKKAISAILDKINEAGELTDTSFGTPISYDLEFYKTIEKTSMPYGQALAIMALGEFLRAFI